MPVLKSSLNQPKAYSINDGVTQSMLQTFMQCRYKSSIQLQGYELAMLTDNFDFGELLHECIEAYYSGRLAEPHNIKSVIELFHKSQLAKGPRPPEALDLAEGLVEAIWPYYVKFWKNRDEKIIWKGIEIPFDIKWHNFRLRGKLDGLLAFMKQTPLWLLENKSKSQIPEGSIEDLLQYDFQTLFYLTVLKHLGYSMGGCVYNVVRKPQLRMSKKENTSQFITRVAEDVAERLDHYFRRYEISFTRQMLERFENELEMKLSQFDSCIQEPLMIFHNETACLGRFTCPFVSHCASGTWVGYSKTRKLFVELETGGELLQHWKEEENANSASSSSVDSNTSQSTSTTTSEVHTETGDGFIPCIQTYPSDI